MFWDPRDICLKFFKKVPKSFLYDRTGICTGKKTRFSHFLNTFQLAEAITDFFIRGGYE